MRGSRTKALRRLLPDETGKPGRKHKGLLDAPPQGDVQVKLATGRKPTIWRRFG